MNAQVDSFSTMIEVFERLCEVYDVAGNEMNPEFSQLGQFDILDEDSCNYAFRLNKVGVEESTEWTSVNDVEELKDAFFYFFNLFCPE